MPNLFELKKQRNEALNACERLLGTNSNHPLSDVDAQQYETHIATVHRLTAQIEPLERQNTLVQFAAANKGRIIPAGEGNQSTRLFPTPKTKPMSEGYFADFHTFLKSKGTRVGPHLEEGADGFGGFKIPTIKGASYEGGSTTGEAVVPSTFDQNIVELAPVETGVRKAAMVMPTDMDIKIGRKTGFGSVALKAESGGSTNLFTDSDATVENFTLSAFMVGGSHKVSWELLQDVPSFQAFTVNDLLLAQAVFEDNLFLTGTGSGQPEGLLGNIGAGITGVTVGSDNYGGELLQATFDVLGTLNEVYHPGASWLMSRATGVAIRKAQSVANLFSPVWTRVGSQDYLHGYPVEYSGNMPAIAAGNTPVIFGNFKLGYVIGDRGGSGISVKLLDQPLATAGQLIILAYCLVDGRVRRSEALQGITLHT